MGSDLADFVKRYKFPIDAEIGEELSRREKEVAEISPELVEIIRAMRELSVGGKRLRGMLTILGYEIAGGHSGPPLRDGVIRAAMVMELFHLGLLIQDDVMDRDTTRRGVKTIHARYPDLHLGEAIAMCAGDFTYAWGMEILSNLKSQILKAQTRLPDGQVIEAMKVWAKYFARVGYGQVLDVMKVADDKTLLQILALKSGEYSCVLPLQLGAALAGANEATMKFLYEYGMELGWVFQLRDDWLALWGDSGKTGKPVGNDAREEKVTLATMYGKERLEEEIEMHREMGKRVVLQCRSFAVQQYVDVMLGLLDWMATREN